MTDESRRSDRRAAWIVFTISIIAYVFFFQGLGWNQMSHFATMRSLAEHGSADISRFGYWTQDVSIFQNGTFSSKPPGVALLGVGPYFALMTCERWMGLDVDAPHVWQGNLAAMTALLSGLPAAIVNVLLFYMFRRCGANLRAAVMLAGAFAFGSLSWPYSGLLFAHELCAALVLAAWLLLTREAMATPHFALAGALLGYAALCDLLIAPIGVIFGLYLIWRRISIRYWLTFAAEPIVAGIVLLIYNRVVHGHAIDMAPLRTTEMFTNSNLYLGLFDWPHWRRLYWITYQPMHGLLSCCPMFVICFIPLLLIRRPVRIAGETIAILGVLVIYILFYLTFLTWTGGWGVGLRFMIPGLPLFWLFSLKAFQRFPRICGVIIAISIFNMLAVTSVCVLYPAPTRETPSNLDPVRSDQIVFLQGRTNRNDNGHNLASLLGVPERFQLIPVFVLLAIYYGYAFTRPRDSSASGGSLTVAAAAAGG